MLHRALSLLTGPRYAVVLGRDFEWSDNSWTHNFFRAFEMVFGRKVGIQVEVVSVNDEVSSWQYAFTVEAQFALFETFLREIPKRLPRLEVVPVPALYAPGFGSLPSLLPYCFAIAYDAGSASDGGTNTTTPTSTSHTCTGSNLALAIGIWNRNNSAGFTPNSVTYNAVSAGTNKVTIANTAGGTPNCFLYGLANPSTGANNVTYTYSSSSVRNGNANVSLTGCAASPFGNVGSAQVQTTSISYSVTTAADNSVVVSVCATDFNVAASATGTNQTYRAGVVEAGGYTTDISTQTTTTAGSYTTSWSRASAGDMTAVSLEVQPLVASTNIKNVDGVTNASIKAVDDVARASIKTIDDVT